MANYLNQLLAANKAANEANILREKQATAIYDEIIRRYQPGGSFEAKSLAELDRLKKRSVTEQYGQSEQQAISGGMFGVQRPTRAGMGMKWEESVGAPARLSLEDVLMQRLSGAQQNKASFIESIQDVGPSLSDIYGMAQAGQSSQASGSISSGSGSLRDPTSLSSQFGQASEKWNQERLAKERTYNTGTTAQVTQNMHPSVPVVNVLTGEKKVGEVKGAWQLDEAAYKKYQQTLATTQPGSVTATPQEFTEIQKRLKQQYGTSPAGAWN